MARNQAQVRSEDLHDDGTEILDMMAPSASDYQRFQNLTIVQDREFDYGEVEGGTLQHEFDSRGEEIISRPNLGRSLEYEAFMEEPVIISIAETTDKNAPPVVFVGINGDNRWLPRNTPIRIPRKFVERLMQAKERSYTTSETSDASVDNRKPVTSKQATSYPFAVLRDENKLGRKWLTRMSRQGT